MAQLTQTILSQVIVPLLVAFGWYIVAGVAGSVMTRAKDIEAWAAANPKRALACRYMRAMGLDIRKIADATKAYAEARAAALLPKGR